MNAITKVERPEKASEMFNVRVAPQKLCKLIGQGPLQIILSASKHIILKEVMDALSSALNTWLAIGQINGDPQKKQKIF
jgi:hypothetical protein